MMHLDGNKRMATLLSVTALALVLSAVLTGCGGPEFDRTGAIIEVNDPNPIGSTQLREPVRIGGFMNEPANPIRAGQIEPQIQDPESLAPASQIRPRLGPIGSQKNAQSITCVSEVVGNPQLGSPEVVRIIVRPAGISHITIVQRGPMLVTPERRAGNPSSSVSHSAATIRNDDAEGVIRTEGTLTAEPGVSRLFALEVTPDGAFHRGTFRDEMGPFSETLSVVCWVRAVDLEPRDFIPVHQPDPAGWARFDTNAGRCLNEAGEEAHNIVPIEYVRETQMGQCADLRGMPLNGDDFGYPTLSGWDLRGALLDGAELNFAQLEHALLDGAQMGAMHLGYAIVHGHVSAETVLPREADCRADGSSRNSDIVCRR